MASVSIEQLHIRLGSVDILKNMDLEVLDGEFLVLLGPSGCGKSTLLHSIAGLIDVWDGAIHIGGQDVTWADPKDRSIGMVFQSYALYPTMTVERNMSFGPRISGIAKDEIDRRVQQAATLLHLEPLLQRKPSQLSGGQRQRVAIGRALVRHASVYLFDEPLSNLDAKLRNELRRELKQLHHDIGKTMIYVTHDQTEAMTLASRIAVMLNGKIQQIGTPAEVYERPVNRFVAGFLGSPSMNFFDGTLQADGERLLWRQSAQNNALVVDVSRYPFARRPASGDSAVLGIRPEHVVLEQPGAHSQGQATVSLAEPMGGSVVLWLGMGGTALSAVAQSYTPHQRGHTLGLRIDPQRVSLFGQESGQRL
ncbi:MAG: ABC transporter ATP-binding protein [Comamonadaceae bacterium]|nr:MAG: ABC transporter ATP-binding protein [Comamonadaceae bacterium]